MRAALLREVDGPFELADVPEPAADGKVLVRVRAAGVNFADVMASELCFEAPLESPGCQLKTASTSLKTPARAMYSLPPPPSSAR